MDIKFLKATKYAFESTTLQFSKAMRLLSENQTIGLQARPGDSMKIPRHVKYHV